VASILWRCPPDTRPAQRFCDYGSIIILFLQIGNSDKFDLRALPFPVYYVWNTKRPATVSSSGALTIGDIRAVVGRVTSTLSPSTRQPLEEVVLS
jgi:hypothetical protein